MIPPKRSVNPLELPTIRTHVASFLSVKDCISCMRVSKDWTMDFAGPVWHTVNFDKHESVLSLLPAIVAKYGHLIRRVLSAAKQKHLSTLHNPGITSLEFLQFFLPEYTPSLASFSDLVRSHKGTLTTLGVSGHLITLKSLEQQQELGNFLSSYTLASGIRLTTLDFYYVRMTRAAISDLLRHTPSLQHLLLSKTRITAYNPTVGLFRHPGITTLTAMRDQVWTGYFTGELVHSPCPLPRSSGVKFTRVQDFQARYTDDDISLGILRPSQLSSSQGSTAPQCRFYRDFTLSPI